MRSYKAISYDTLSSILLLIYLCHGPLQAYEPDEKPTITNTKDTQATALTFYIRKILIEDAKFLSKRSKQKLIAPYINNYLDTNKISQLVQDLKAFYIKLGYPTTQVKVVIGQSLREGILKLVVINGFIEAIKLNQHTLREKAKVATAFPLLRGKPLYLNHVEQGIDQINATPSSHATLKILPGLQEGGSIIQIDNLVIHPLRLEVGGDNLGEEEVGQWRGKVNLGLDNLLSINDNLMLHCASNKAKELAGHKLKSQACMASFSFPVGYYTFSTTHSMGSSIIPAKSKHHTSLHLNKNRSHSYEAKRLIYKTSAHKHYFS
ncbi:MAG: ShlB/FhaC/HecB family hemolysin secretion/activation protein [Bacteroidota bacterium]